jgi:hypothetical protein
VLPREFIFENVTSDLDNEQIDELLVARVSVWSRRPQHLRCSHRPTRRAALAWRRAGCPRTRRFARDGFDTPQLLRSVKLPAWERAPSDPYWPPRSVERPDAQLTAIVKLMEEQQRRAVAAR